MGKKEHSKQISLAYVGSAHSVWATLGLPQLMVVCASPVFIAQALGCSAGMLSKADPAFPALPRSKLLRFRFSATPQRHRLGWGAFVPFLGPSSSGDQVLGECTVLGGPCILITSLILVARCPGCAVRAPSQVCHILLWGADLRLQLSWWMSIVQDPRKVWLAAGSLVTVLWRMLVSGAEIAPCLPTLAVPRLPLCLRQGKGPVHSQLALLWYLLNPFLCEQARLHFRLEP